MFEIRKENYAIITQDDGYKSNLYHHLDIIDLTDKFVFVVYFEDLMPTINMNPVYPDVSWIIHNIDLYRSIHTNKKFILLIDGGWEGPTYKHNFKKSLDRICEECNIQLSDVAIYGGSHVQPDCPIRNAINIGMAFSNNCFKNAVGSELPNKHFISLARVAKPHRVYATVEMLDRELDRFGYMSLGSGYYNNPGENFDLRLVPPKYEHRVPLYIDGPVIGAADHQQHVAVDSRFTSCFVNFAMETSYDAEISPFTWNSHMISEKTTKPFTWGQVPIFLTVSNRVQYLRDYGFDVFDDIIDHDSYDLEQNPKLRIVKAVDQLEKICRWDIQQCVDYKVKNMDRFLTNRYLAEHYERYKKSDISFANLKRVLDSYT
jgi:hypothetical protein